MKGIVLAGGSGTRLYPMTRGVSKQLIPIYNKPMVYYPISVLMLAGIRDILIISTPDDLPAFRRLLGDGKDIGVNFSYAEQPRPEGLAQAFIIGREWIGNDDVCLVLGDNIFYGQGFTAMLENALANAAKGLATVFAYPVSGLYFYPNSVVDIAAGVKPSERGELEITSVNHEFMLRGTLKVQRLGRGFAWLDTGTVDALAEASDFIGSIEKRQGFKVAALEEIAFRKKWIDVARLKELALPMQGNDYGRYLLNLAENGVE